MKRRTIGLASVLTVAFLLLPTVLSADTVDSRGTSTSQVGTNHVTWDSNFVDHGYAPGTPVTMRINWHGTERVAGLVSMGLATQFSPPGVQGQIVGIQRMGTDGALVSVEFTRLHSGSEGVANAFLHMNLAVDDGTGRIVIRPFPVKCHVTSE